MLTVLAALVGAGGAAGAAGAGVPAVLAGPSERLLPAARHEAAVLPAPARVTRDGVPLGFPPTVAGAVSAYVRWHPLLVPNEEERQVAVFRTVATPEFAAVEVPELREAFRNSSVPPERRFAATPLGFQVLTVRPGTTSGGEAQTVSVTDVATGTAVDLGADGGRVQVAVLYALDMRDGDVVAPTSYHRMACWLEWTGEDWRLDGYGRLPSTLRVPSSDEPAEIRAAGWRTFRLA